MGRTAYMYPLCKFPKAAAVPLPQHSPIQARILPKRAFPLPSSPTPKVPRSTPFNLHMKVGKKRNEILWRGWYWREGLCIGPFLGMRLGATWKERFIMAVPTDLLSFILGSVHVKATTANPGQGPKLGHGHCGPGYISTSKCFGRRMLLTNPEAFSGDT